MTDWVNAELDRLFINPGSGKLRDILDEYKWAPDGEATDWEITWMAVERAVRRADNTGNLEPLRKDLLHLTGHDLSRFLKRPAKQRGEKFSKDVRNDRAKKAASQTLFIKELWRREYPGHHRRPKGDLVRAEDIAAKRNGITVEQVLSKLKNPRRE
jgi:hypothetical protein